MNKSYSKNSYGFSLVEMAVVLAIVGFLLGGLLLPVSVQMDIKSSNETRQKISIIKEAIIGYSLANGRLPCPAGPALPSNAVNAGTEDCSLTRGVVPWSTLGTAELDAWGGRFSYILAPSASNVQISLTTVANINVHNISGVTMAQNVPVVIISHGKNGFGSFRTNGTQLSYALASTSEVSNIENLSPIVYGDQAMNGYDDFVDWIPLNILFNRLVSAGRIP